MANGQLSTWATVALFWVISAVTVSSEGLSVGTRLRGPHVCGLKRGRCCRGWNASLSQRCTIPVCGPSSCSPGGTCIRPYLCRCANGNINRTCSSSMPDLDTHARLKRMADDKTRVKYTKKNSFEGPCSSTSCDHICENLSDNSYRCSCREGYLLHANKRYCIRAMFTGWTRDQHAGIPFPTNTGQPQEDDRRKVGNDFLKPNVDESKYFLDLTLKDDEFKKVPNAYLPSSKYDYSSSEQKSEGSYKPEDGKYFDNGKADLEDQKRGIPRIPWDRADIKVDEKSQQKEATINRDEESQAPDWLEADEESLTRNQKKKYQFAKEKREPKIRTEKTNLKVPDIEELHNFYSLRAKRRKHKTDYFSEETRVKLPKDVKRVDVEAQKKDEERKYFEETEFEKKEFERNEQEKRENYKKENVKKEIETKVNDKKGYGKKKNEKKDEGKKESGNKEFRKKEYGKKESWLSLFDDQPRRRLISLVKSPKFHNGMLVREENDKKLSPSEKGKKYARIPADPKTKAAGKQKAEKEGESIKRIQTSIDTTNIPMTKDESRYIDFKKLIAGMDTRVALQQKKEKNIEELVNKK